MLISFILFLGYWRLAKQVWATSAWYLFTRLQSILNTKSLEKSQNFEKQQYIKPSHYSEIKAVSKVMFSQELKKKKSQQQKNEKIQ